MTIQHNISQIEKANWKRHNDARTIKALEEALAVAKAENVRLASLARNLAEFIVMTRRGKK